MEFEEIKFESEDSVKKPISDITYHFSQCIRAIGSFRNNITDKINKYMNLFETENRRLMSLEELEEMGKIVFSINTIWNSFGSLLMPIKGTLIFEFKNPVMYREIVKRFDSSDKIIDEITDHFTKEMNIDSEEKIMSEFMISSSYILSSIQTLMSIKNMDKLDNIWYSYREFCFQDIFDFLKGIKELNEEFDNKFNIYSGKILDIFFAIETLDCPEISENKLIHFIIEFINAYLYATYDDLKTKTVKMYNEYKKWSSKKDYKLIK